MDWEVLKREYVTTNISYRKMSVKYNIPFGTLKHNAIKGHWYKQREQYRHEVNTESLENAKGKATDYKSVLYDLAYNVAQQLSDMTSKYTLEKLIAMGVKPRDITGAIKDLEDALHVKSEADIKEQEARIKKLQRDAAVSDNDGKKYGVLILPPVKPIENPEGVENE